MTQGREAEVSVVLTSCIDGRNSFALSPMLPQSARERQREREREREGGREGGRERRERERES